MGGLPITLRQNAPKFKNFACNLVPGHIYRTLPFSERMICSGSNCYAIRVTKTFVSQEMLVIIQKIYPTAARDRKIWALSTRTRIANPHDPASLDTSNYLSRTRNAKPVRTLPEVE